MTVVYTASDLHLFCRRSEAHRHMDSLNDAAAAADVFVLNGDIVDFRWSEFGTHARTVQEGIRWLHRFVTRCPQCEFHYVLGNHDSVLPYMIALNDFARRSKNLWLHPYYVKVGSALFLHGDMAHRRMRPRDLARARRRCMNHERRGELLNRVWDKAFDMGIHRTIQDFASPTEIVVKNIRFYLDAAGQGPKSGTRSVYFGHTHVAVAGYEHRGLRYYNGGAPLRGLEFRLLRADVGH